MFNGIICINKPKDFTSFDVVKKLRGMTKVKKIGHAGTLDPMATGVLPIFFGVATKACDILPNQTKRYTAEFRLGIKTNTQDIWGEVINKTDKKVKKEDILLNLPYFTGDVLQIPPMFSAIQINGQRLYDLARKGIEVERTPRKIHVYSIELLSFDEENQQGVLDIFCSKGTYIRTIIEDLGEKLGSFGVMTSLNRTESSGFTLKDTYTFEEIETALKNNSLSPLPVEKAFLDYPYVKLNAIQTRMFLNGVKLDLNRINYPDKAYTVRVYGAENDFLGLADCDKQNKELKLLKFFIERK